MERATTRTQENYQVRADVPEIGFSLFTFPRRLTHPTSGRSPDSRLNGLAAFPTFQSVAFWPALSDHSGGAVPDFHRASLSSFQRTRSKLLLLITLAGEKCQVMRPGQLS